MRRFIAKEEFDENEDFVGVDVTTATEELEVMEEEGRELGAEILAENAEAERSVDIADSLEDIAVVADGVEEATPAETQLVQIAGDMATAGSDDVSAEDVVPATEHFVGRRIATEGLVEKAKEIWEAIKRWLKNIWKKVETFFYKIFGAVPRLRKQVEALRKRLTEVQDKGWGIKSESKTFELSSGLEGLRVGDSVKKKYTELKDAVKVSKASFEKVFLSKDFAKYGDEIAKLINDFDPETEDQAKKSLGDIVTKIDNNTYFNGGKANSATKFGSDVSVKDFGDMLGGKSLIKRIKISKNFNALSALEKAEIVRTLRIEFTNLTNKKLKTPESVKFETLNNSEIEAALDDAETLLDTLERFHRGSARKDILKSAKEIEKACDKVEKQYDSVDEEATGRDTILACTRAVYKLNMVYASVVSAATTQGFNLCLSNVRTLIMLASRSLSQYGEK